MLFSNFKLNMPKTSKFKVFYAIFPTTNYCKWSFNNLNLYPNVAFICNKKKNQSLWIFMLFSNFKLNMPKTSKFKVFYAIFPTTTTTTTNNNNKKFNSKTFPQFSIP